LKFLGRTALSRTGRGQKLWAGFLYLCLVFLSAFSADARSVEIPKLTEAPTIDGALDGPAWRAEALRIDDFLQTFPREKGEPSEKTVAYIGWMPFSFFYG